MSGASRNRLRNESSPYLLQHAENPVDWHPWGDEAFAKAKQEDKPVFLSIGYSTCHWCHVMAHESFEEESVADVLNRLFVPIKVDREERPDIDDIYMAATQLLTGRGGWPNSVWLTPDRRPWYAGTYFPRSQFIQLLNALHEAWSTQRQTIEAQADRLAQAIRDIGARETQDDGPALSRALVDQAINDFGTAFDQEFGGQEGAPKFPPHSMLLLLLHEHQQHALPGALAMAVKTLDGMTSGGIHDHLGGGFHRYATDREWQVPHFEKMLYDNAQLAVAFARAFSLTKMPRYRDAAAGICDWVLREMVDDTGGFYSAIDADSEGIEGRFYVWSRREIISVLGEAAAERFCAFYNITDTGNYHEEATGSPMGSNILYLTTGEVITDELWSDLEAARDDLENARCRLLEMRNSRVWPHIDDKIIVAWNGLMISGLAVAGQLLDVPRYVEAASRAADFLCTQMRQDDNRLLFHMFRRGDRSGSGFLDDYTFLAKGLLDLFSVTQQRRFLDAAHELLVIVQQDFADTRGGFYQTSREHEDLLMRPKDPLDHAVPSGNGAAASALAQHARLTGEAASIQSARATVHAFGAAIERAPQYCASLVLAYSELADLDASQLSNAQGAVPDVTSGSPKVSVSAFRSHSTVAPGDSFDIALKVQIDDPYYIHSENVIRGDVSQPTSLGLDKSEDWELRGVDFPPQIDVQISEEQVVPGYRGVVWLVAHLVCAGEARAGTSELTLSLSFQPCEVGACLKPATLRLTVAMTISGHGQRVSCQREALFQPLTLTESE